jgi:hypothetical protein
MAIEHDFQSHRDTWTGFAKLMKWTVILVVLLLIGMAIFLV